MQAPIPVFGSASGPDAIAETAMGTDAFNAHEIASATLAAGRIRSDFQKSPVPSIVDRGCRERPAKVRRVDDGKRT